MNELIRTLEEHRARWDEVRAEAWKRDSEIAWGLANARVETWEAALRLARNAKERPSREGWGALS